MVVSQIWLFSAFNPDVYEISCNIICPQYPIPDVYWEDIDIIIICIYIYIYIYIYMYIYIYLCFLNLPYSIIIFGTFFLSPGFSHPLRCFEQCFGMRYVTFDCGFSISPATKLLMCSDREMAVLLRETTGGTARDGPGRELTWGVP